MLLDTAHDFCAVNGPVHQMIREDVIRDENHRHQALTELKASLGIIRMDAGENFTLNDSFALNSMVTIVKTIPVGYSVSERCHGM